MTGSRARVDAGMTGSGTIVIPACFKRGSMRNSDITLFRIKNLWMPAQIARA
jgi:hypothetical protein